MKARYYVGARLRDADTQERIVFTSATIPTSQSHGARYIYVIGPFRTERGARFMAEHGANNPHCQHVDDAERIAADIARRERLYEADDRKIDAHNADYFGTFGTES